MIISSRCAIRPVTGFSEIQVLAISGPEALVEIDHGSFATADRVANAAARQALRGSRCSARRQRGRPPFCAEHTISVPFAVMPEAPTTVQNDPERTTGHNPGSDAGSGAATR